MSAGRPPLSNEPGLDRREAIKTLLADRGDLLLVTGLGSTTYDAASVGDDAGNFYLWGAMGAAAMVGLGLAIARPERRVLVVTGDGEMLMGLGALATIGVQRPPNLAIVVFDNGHYGETGMQPSHTHTEAAVGRGVGGGVSPGVNLVGVARSCGIDTAFDICDMAELKDLAQRLRHFSGPLFARIAIAADEPPRVLPSRDGAWLKDRFRRALGTE